MVMKAAPHSHSRCLSLGTHRALSPQSRSQDLGVMPFCAHTDLLSSMENRLGALASAPFQKGWRNSVLPWQNQSPSN